MSLTIKPTYLPTPIVDIIISYSIRPAYIYDIKKEYELFKASMIYNYSYKFKRFTFFRKFYEEENLFIINEYSSIINKNIKKEKRLKTFKRLKTEFLMNDILLNYNLDLQNNFDDDDDEEEEEEEEEDDEDNEELYRFNKNGIITQILN